MKKIFGVFAAFAAIGATVYVFRDKIKESKVYDDLKMDDKLTSLKNLVNDKLSKDDDEDDLFDDDELVFDEDQTSSSERNYVSLNTDMSTADADEENGEVPTIDI
ncbi:MAG: hypothetical protein IKQ71_11205 [Lachnospiraceae bacterium]|nr:hypothetical protein [Lachnospiraceae bacterium]